MNKILTLLYLCFSFTVFASEKETGQLAGSRWQLGSNEDIVWNVSSDNRLPHSDNIEMSGRQVSTIITYSIDAQKKLRLSKQIIWPSMILKYDFRSYLMSNDSVTPPISINGKAFILPSIEKVTFDGILHFSYDKAEMAIHRSIFPSTDKPAVFDLWEIQNTGKKTISIDVKDFLQSNTFQGAENSYTVTAKIKGQQVALKKGEKLLVSVEHSAFIAGHAPWQMDALQEMQKRQALIHEINNKLVLQTPDAVLNRAFQFAKIRTSESLFDSKMGLVHSPGGGRYYAGIWANDQVEYAGPFFPNLGYSAGNLASMNAYKKFMDTMTAVFKPIPYSYEMQGMMTSTGAGDRGDASMYAWGASLFALESGDVNTAKVLWPAIQWCLEYTQRQITPDGVVASNSDEMEGRIATGKANLSTSCLAYGAFTNAAYLAKALNEPACIIEKYTQTAANLKQAIEKYFGADIEGYHTYRYYAGHQTFRHWICLPLVMGINDRKEGTIRALFEKLWTPDGLLVEKDLKTFWDRATLYALRGILKGGETELAMGKLTDYSRQRLLGEHVPYPVEAWPEGNQAHLAAESALYCRIYLEGLFGIQPTGFNSFTCIPRLPKGWEEMSLSNVNAFESTFTMKVTAIGQKSIELTILKEGQEIYSKTDLRGSEFNVEL
jgi:hypothetical protein